MSMGNISDQLILYFSQLGWSFDELDKAIAEGNSIDYMLLILPASDYSFKKWKGKVATKHGQLTFIRSSRITAPVLRIFNHPDTEITLHES